MITQRNNHEFNVVQALVPDWIAADAIYANSKFDGKNPQLQTIDGKFGPEDTAHVNFFHYISDFVVHAEQAGNDSQGLLLASRALGKHVGVGRALCSAVKQKINLLSLETSDRQVLEEFENDWFGFAEFTELPTEDLRTNLKDITETQVTLISEVLDNPFELAKRAKNIFLEQAKLFGGFTLLTGVLAEPGVSSSAEESPQMWSEFAVLN